MIYFGVFTTPHSPYASGSYSDPLDSPSRPSPKCHEIISFADPHLLNSILSYRCKNRGGVAPTGRTAIPVRYLDLSPLLATLTQTPGVSRYSSHFGTHPVNPYFLTSLRPCFHSFSSEA